MTTNDWDSMVTVGRIVRPHGHRGAVVVQPETDFAAERFAAGNTLQWKRADGVGETRISSSREFQGRWIVTFEGIATMNDAEMLRDVELRIPAEAVKTLAPGAHYVYDLEGCEVMNVDGADVGRVTRVEFGAATPLLVVTRPNGREVLIPLAADICREIDSAAKRIVVDLPEGLLDLNA